MRIRRLASSSSAPRGSAAVMGGRSLMPGGLVLASVISGALLTGYGVESSLGEVNQNLLDLRSDLDARQQSVDQIARLDLEIEASVERLDSVQSSLADLDQEIQSVAVSLRELDAHLASVRTTFKRLDALGPFVEIADPTPVEKPE